MRPITNGLLQLIKQIADKVHEIVAGNNTRVQGVKDLLDNTIMPVLRNDFSYVDPAELEIIAASAVLGPKRAGVPPLPLLRELLVMKQQYRQTHYAEISIKYGIFPQHRTMSGNSDWDNIWPGARGELSNLFYYAVTNAYRQLKRRVFGLPAINRYNLTSDAEIMSMKFLEPLSKKDTDMVTVSCLPEVTEIKPNKQPKIDTPLGGRHVLTVFGEDESNINIFWPNGTKTTHPNCIKIVVKAAEAFTTMRIEPKPKVRIPKIWEWNDVKIKNVSYIQVWECTCGKSSCETKHRLEAWDPGVVHNLRSFIDSAMWGPIPITTGGLAGGMYFALLNE